MCGSLVSTYLELCASWIWMSISFPILGKFSATISSNNFLPFSPLVGLCSSECYFTCCSGLLRYLHLLKFFVILLVCLGDFHCFVSFIPSAANPNHSASSSVFLVQLFTSPQYFHPIPISLLKFSLCSTILLPNLMSNFMIIIELCQETAYLCFFYFFFWGFILFLHLEHIPWSPYFCLIIFVSMY